MFLPTSVSGSVRNAEEAVKGVSRMILNTRPGFARWRCHPFCG
ncbi:hypothetical protein HMPREF9374_1570 [Desmospora sp. 8437]|nr:hypothetical protein HMPREF9374_1570 [Desmospora sp. 8437]